MLVLKTKVNRCGCLILLLLTFIAECLDGIFDMIRQAAIGDGIGLSSRAELLQIIELQASGWPSSLRDQVSNCESSGTSNVRHRVDLDKNTQITLMSLSNLLSKRRGHFG